MPQKLLVILLVWLISDQLFSEQATVENESEVAVAGKPSAQHGFIHLTSPTEYSIANGDLVRLRHIKRAAASWPDDSTIDSLSKAAYPTICFQSPLLIADDQQNGDIDRSLCPWKWKINRNYRRRPKLLPEAVCLCRYARGFQMAHCMPILRDVQVQLLVERDMQEGSKSDRYVDAHETISVGCHAVVPNIRLAQHFIPPPIWQEML